MGETMERGSSGAIEYHDHRSRSSLNDDRHLMDPRCKRHLLARRQVPSPPPSKTGQGEPATIANITCWPSSRRLHTHQLRVVSHVCLERSGEAADTLPQRRLV